MKVSNEERRALDNFIERLTKSHPGIERDQLVNIVESTHASFNDARVRDFIPLFVERRVHVLLGEHDAAGTAPMG